MRKIIYIVIMIFCISSTSTNAQTRLASYVVGNGAVVISNGNHTLSATIGQSIIGSISNTSHINNVGFWYQYVKTITDVEENLMLETPREFELFQNYPNPFNPTTVIRYGLPKESNVKVIVYNILGEMVNTLVDNVQKAGYYEVNWNAANNSSGVYFYKIMGYAPGRAGDFVDVKKMLLLR